MMRRTTSRADGFIMPTVLSFIVAALIFIGAVTQVIFMNFSIVGRNEDSQQAFNIAEAGVNYYLWHLSHNGIDYKDGKTTPASPDPALGYGPYEHVYIDDNAVNQGSFTLWIKPKGGGSTLVDVRSIGKVKGSKITRTLQAQIGATSFGNYALVSDSELWFGNTESSDGPVHSNVGIRMDGPSNDTVSSSNATYVPSTSFGGDGSTSRAGVWCNPTVTTPTDCNTRSKSDWIYPTTDVDFNQINSSLCTIKKAAFAADPATAALATQSNACSQVPTTRTASYLPQRASTYSATKGYLVQLNPNGTYDLSTVNNENDTLTPYTAALSPTSVATGIAIPSSGVIFSEDNVWVRSNPTFHGRVTIAAGRLATTNTATIKIVDNLAYSTKNGDDAIGLVAENSVLIAPYAAPATGNFTLEVNASMLAQSGDVLFPGSYSFDGSCTRGWVGAGQRLNFFGSIGTRQIWTWSWQRSSACGLSALDSASGYYISGFKNNTTQYDSNLLYAPPPSYPITGGYNILVWREVLTKP